MNGLRPTQRDEPTTHRRTVSQLTSYVHMLKEKRALHSVHRVTDSESVIVSCHNDSTRGEVQDSINFLSSCGYLLECCLSARGIMVLLAALSMVTAPIVTATHSATTLLFDPDLYTVEDQVDIVSNTIGLLIWIAAMITIVLIYRWKTQLYIIESGRDVALKRFRSSFELLTLNPHLGTMLLEISLWSVFTPPLLVRVFPAATILDVGCFLRSYAVVVWWTGHRYSKSVACRCLAKLSHLHFTPHFMLATVLSEKPFMSMIVVIWTFWTIMSLLFSRLEERNFGDSFYFVWVSTGTIGYGDIYPRTWGGRIVGMLCGAFMWFIVSFCIDNFNADRLKAKDFDGNMSVLMYAFVGLCNKRIAAAKLIQSIFRLLRARKKSNASPVGPILRRQLVAVNDFASCVRLLRSERHLFSEQHYSWCASRSLLEFQAVRRASNKLIKDFDKVTEPYSTFSYHDMFSSRKGKSEALRMQELENERIMECMRRIERKTKHLDQLLQRICSSEDP